MGFWFTLRWAARDLRRRWAQVLAIALIIGIGTGVYAGLGSTAAWRRQSNDESFAMLHMYDLRVTTAEGVDAPTGEMAGGAGHPARSRHRGHRRGAVHRRHPGRRQHGRQVDPRARSPGRDGPQRRRPARQRACTSPRATGDRCPSRTPASPWCWSSRTSPTSTTSRPSGTLRVAGDQEVTSVGIGLSPEYFFVMTEEGGFFAEANFAVLFTSLETAQHLAGRPGRVNDLVLTARARGRPGGRRP